MPWGYNVNGQVGDGTTTNRRLYLISNLSGVQSVSAGVRSLMVYALK